MKHHVKRILGFALLPSLSLLASLFLLPLISRRFGEAGWVSLGLGQSIGAIVSVVVSLAWPVVGGNLVAKAGPAQQKEIYRASLQSRLVVLAFMLALAIPLVHLLAPQFPWTTATFMVGIAFNGLSASWYYAGTGRPMFLVLNEGVVRVLGYLVALIGLLMGAPLFWYAAATVCAGLTMVGLNWATVMGRDALHRRGDFGIAWRMIRQQLGGAGSQVLMAGFAYGGPTIFSVLAPAYLPLFSALDQIQKSANNALTVLPNSFVSWVGSAPAEQRARRIRLSITFLASSALLIVPAWVLLGPTLVRLLFADQLVVGLPGHLVLAATIASELICVSIALLVLVPAGQEKRVYLADAVSACIGVGLVLVGALVVGPFGGLAARIAVNLGLLAFFVMISRRAARRSCPASPIAPA